jgi:DNA-binding transcriptional MerR regulator
VGHDTSVDRSSAAVGAKALPAIPAKRYFTIGEVSDLCQVKPYVLRYWEQEFTQLKPMKRRGNRRYYQHHEVLLIRRIRDLLYEQGFTISGARNRLADAGTAASMATAMGAVGTADDDSAFGVDDDVDASDTRAAASADVGSRARAIVMAPDQLRVELLAIRRLLAN